VLRLPQRRRHLARGIFLAGRRWQLLIISWRDVVWKLRFGMAGCICGARALLGTPAITGTDRLW